jgi:hypothetical protein
MKTIYRGFHNVSELPIKQGQTLTLPKGTIYRHRGELREVKRATTIKVHSLQSGRSLCVGRIYKDGEVHFSFMSRNDPELIKKVYGHAIMEDLWPLMTVNEYGSVFLPVSNPEVTWAGAGGYWSDADINQFVDG